MMQEKWFYDVQIRDARKVLAQAALIDAGPPTDADFYFALGDTPRIMVTTLDGVHRAKRYAATVFGATHYEIYSRWGSGEACLTSWKSPDTDVQIWLECKVADYPAELQGEHCRWVRDDNAKSASKPVPSYSFVCDTEKKGSDNE